MTMRMTAAPFDAIADTYDESFSDSSIGRAQRRVVWMETDRTFQAGQRILEINCGTGIDALHLAHRGVAVLACDASPRMIAVALPAMVLWRRCRMIPASWCITRQSGSWKRCSHDIFVSKVGRGLASRFPRLISNTSRFGSPARSNSLPGLIRGLADAEAFGLWQTMSC